jgi:hypothetical protein
MWPIAKLADGAWPPATVPRSLAKANTGSLSLMARKPVSLLPARLPVVPNRFRTSAAWPDW